VTPGAGNSRETAMLRKQNKQIAEENNLLKIKYEILLDMVTILLYSLRKTAWANISVLGNEIC
jgi:Chibby family